MKTPAESLHRHHHLVTTAPACMGSPMLLLFMSFCALFHSPRAIFVSIIYVNFTASYQQFIDEAGAFLVSDQGSFQSRVANSDLEPGSFYLVVTHLASNTIVWSANRNHPVSRYWQLRLTADGLTLHNDTSQQPIWSSPQYGSSVHSMQLLDSGNLVLLDAGKNILWQSFDFPTDVLVAGQKLRVGNPLVSSSGEGQLSEGIYRFVVGDDDAMLQWNGMTYWKLWMDVKAFRDTALSVEFLMMNITGVFLMGGNGEEVVIKRDFDLKSAANSSDFVFAKVDHKGLLSVVRIKSAERRREHVFQVPVNKCGIPMICGRLGVCSDGDRCLCPLGFHRTTEDGDCVAKDTSMVLSGSCKNGSSSDDLGFKYLSLRNDLKYISDMDYFSNKFTHPVIRRVNVSFCQNLCSRNCSCLGVLYARGSGSCYMILNYLGSIQMGSTDRAAYIKILAAEPQTQNSDGEKKADFPILAVALVPCIGVLGVAMVTGVCLRRRRLSKRSASSKLGTRSSHSSTDEEMDLVSIPGQPVRLDFEELAEATEGFSTRIGSGGFGTVYKATLRDGSDVAVKKITCLGAQGKREFLTEIAAIGKIRHINLVRLKGFCRHSGQRLLVYEYMERSSLDRILFQGEPVLEWKERFEIVVGAARGLAYLHSGCEHKIIHCDVKPENILLNDNLQAKISDFGLAKLLTREESGFFTTMRGTRGYVAPEWLTNTAISDKTDVYSYGMVLLEIVSGRKNFSLQRQINSPEEYEQCLINFPRRALEMHVAKRYIELVDPRLKGNALSEEVEKLVRVALCCLHREPSLRPSMSNVVRMLEGGMALCKPRMKSLDFLRSYGPGALAENGQQSEITLDRQEMSSATNSESDHSFSYISSQQVSGPR